MRLKRIPVLMVASLLLLGGVLLSAQAQEADTVYLPMVAGPAATPTPIPLPTDRPTPSFPAVYGYVQKGPFIQGTEITVRELDTNLIPTGRTFSGVIDDNTGSFVVRGVLESPYVELSATGFYFNEVSGVLSASPINLLAVVDTRENTSIFVNILTHLERRRVGYLFDQGVPFAQAKAQAQQEILNVFGIEATGINISERLDISSAGDGNAILLAVSALLQSDKSEAQLTELLSTISSDLRLDGVLDSASARQTLMAAMEYLKPLQDRIRSNIVGRYAELGIVANIPAFEEHAFELDTVPPQVVKIWPPNNADIDIGQVTLNFSDIMKHASVNNNTIVLTDPQNRPIAGTLTTTDIGSSTSVVFTPTTTLSAGLHTLRVSTQVKDLGGNSLSFPFSASFTHTPFDPKAEVLIPAGTFQMGCDADNVAEDGCSNSWNENEVPLHSVFLDAYYIDKYEVTNARYQACVDADVCLPSPATSTYDPVSYPNYPITNVTWQQANTFCTWEGKRLPTEAEWEKAARGTEDTRMYPWGNEPITYELANSDTGKREDVGSHPLGASSYGVMDMVGNVREWVSDWYGPYGSEPTNNPQGPVTGTVRVQRSGSYFDTRAQARVAARFAWDPESPYATIGIRCARWVTPPPIPTPTPTPNTAEEIFISAGTFQMGCDASNSEESCNGNELPPHIVHLDDYYIDKYEITNARYKACVDAGECTALASNSSQSRPSYYGNPLYANYPVIYVNWHQANTFCAWAGGRLPTEAEWEKAARGSSDTRKYPWGDTDPSSTLLNYNYNAQDTSVVGSYPAGASPYGVMDMAGNVSEWVNDWYQENYYSVSPDSNPPGAATGEHRVMRGGTWKYAIGIRVAARDRDNPDYALNYVTLGFRCARSP